MAAPVLTVRLEGRTRQRLDAQHGGAAVTVTTKLLTTAQAAELLAVHPDTVRRLIADGRLRYLRVGRSVRIDAADLDDFLATCEVKPWRGQR